MSIEIEFPSLNEGVKSSFRWWLSTDKLNKYRRVCKGECRYKLLTMADRLLPFQVYSALAQPHTITWQIFDDNGDMVWEPSTSLFTLLKVDGYWYYLYLGDPIGVALPSGYFTSVITITSGAETETWYSEDFYVGNSCPEALTFDAEFAFDECVRVTADTANPNKICADATECEPLTFYFSPINGAVTIPLTFYGIKVRVTKIIGGTAPQMVFVVGGGDAYEISATGDYVVNVLSGYSGQIEVGIVGGALVCFEILGLVQFDSEAGCWNKLEWWQDCGIAGEIVYGSTGYKNWLFIPSEIEITDQTPTITQEGFENGEHDVTYTFRKRITKFQMDLGLLPPYLLEALAEMSIHKFVKLTMYNHGADLLSDVVVNGDYGEVGGGCSANVSMEFGLDDTTVLTQCCDAEIEDDPCIDDDVVQDYWGGCTAWSTTGTPNQVEAVLGQVGNCSNVSNQIQPSLRYKVITIAEDVAFAEQPHPMQVDFGGVTFYITESGTTTRIIVATTYNQFEVYKSSGETTGRLTFIVCQLKSL